MSLKIRTRGKTLDYYVHLLYELTRHSKIQHDYLKLHYLNRCVALNFILQYLFSISFSSRYNLSRRPYFSFLFNYQEHIICFGSYLHLRMYCIIIWKWKCRIFLSGSLPLIPFLISWCLTFSSTLILVMGSLTVLRTEVKIFLKKMWLTAIFRNAIARVKLDSLSAEGWMYKYQYFKINFPIYETIKQ